jgi:hypothetical protein
METERQKTLTLLGTKQTLAYCEPIYAAGPALGVFPSIAGSPPSLRDLGSSFETIKPHGNGTAYPGNDRNAVTWRGGRAPIAALLH